MMDEHNTFDLAKFIRPDSLLHELTDTSGRPWPEGVSVTLNSGVRVPCDVKYQGTAPHTRLFTVIAEIDWENYHPTILWVDVMPSDVEFRLRIPGLDDDTANRMAAGIELRPERIIYL